MTVASRGVTTLFGYCRWHQKLGGRSWCRSSPVVRLDMGLKLARTMSGRLYALGERIGVAALPDEEARLAHFFLTGREQPWSDPDRQADLMWLAAQKVARWIGVPAPARGRGDELSRYLRGTRTAYFAALQAASGGRP